MSRKPRPLPVILNRDALPFFFESIGPQTLHDPADRVLDLSPIVFERHPHKYRLYPRWAAELEALAVSPGAPREHRFPHCDIESMPRDTELERFHYTRVRWLFTLLYLRGLRIAEVSSSTMGQFFSRCDVARHDRWWLEVTGKGDRQRLVPATAEMMAELASYRREHDPAALPSPGETTPLVLPVGQTRKSLSRAALHRIVKDVFRGAAGFLRARGNEAAERASRLEQASAHWLRHSAGSHMADQQVDLRLVRENLGHASVATTSQYLHVDDDRRHRETEDKHRIKW
jgi:integrase/recombinase XerD